MCKLAFLISVLGIGACTSVQNSKPIPPTTYPVVETIINEYNLPEYKRPENFISLPIEVFTWYPKGTTLSVLIKEAGTLGALVWRDNCLLFSPYKKDYLVTPIFWANSVVDYKINGNGNDELVHHFGKHIHLNEWYYTPAVPIPKENLDESGLIYRGKDNCLMDKVIYLNQHIFESDGQDPTTTN